MQIIKGDKTIFVDCDDTLVMWDDKYKVFDEAGNPINTKLFDCHGTPTRLVPNVKNISYVKKSKKLGQCQIIVWSLGGWEWAQQVVEALELTEYVDAVMCKPTVSYVDDLNAMNFFPKRVWYDHKP